MTAIESERAPRRLAVAVTAAVLAVAIGSACATPEQKYRMLSFFFDGVPPLQSSENLKAAVGPDEVVTTDARLWQRSSAQWVVHDPYDGEDCGECHASELSNELVLPRQELCWNCHDQEDFEGEVLHGPVAAGRCDGCHNPHRTRFESLLVVAPAVLCEQCHDQSTFANLGEHRGEQGDDCIECHDPHAADRDFMLREDVGEP
jgi:predicted CXXCH cytochrome family protein